MEKLTTTVLNTRIAVLSQETDYDPKRSDIDKKQLEHDYNIMYIRTTQKFNRITVENVTYFKIKTSKFSN